MEAVLSYLFQILPELGLAVLFACVAWWLSNKLNSMDNHFSKTDSTLNELQGDIKRLSNNISDIQLFITSKFPSALNTFALKMSPLILNEFGSKLFDDCGGKIILDTNHVLLFDNLDKKKPKTALDVEIGAREVLFSLVNDDMFNGIKVWVYNSPAWKIDGKDRAISLEDVCFVLSIPLRDRYLELHPEIAR